MSKKPFLSSKVRDAVTIVSKCIEIENTYLILLLSVNLNRLPKTRF